jgi:hypothetical protein
MDITLTRTQNTPQGIFGNFTDEDGNQICVTLEHAYQNSDGTWGAKIPDGTYICQRGQHQLENMTSPFETFEVMDVPNHSNILIHMGNFDKDSSGCILVGQAIAGSSSSEMITNSVATFNKFMQLQTGVDSFILTVTL